MINLSRYPVRLKHHPIVEYIEHLRSVAAVAGQAQRSNANFAFGYYDDKIMSC